MFNDQSLGMIRDEEEGGGRGGSPPEPLSPFRTTKGQVQVQVQVQVHGYHTSMVDTRTWKALESHCLAVQWRTVATTLFGNFGGLQRLSWYDTPQQTETLVSSLYIKIVWKWLIFFLPRGVFSLCPWAWLVCVLDNVYMEIYLSILMSETRFKCNQGVFLSFCL